MKGKCSWRIVAPLVRAGVRVPRPARVFAAGAVTGLLLAALLGLGLPPEVALRLFASCWNSGLPLPWSPTFSVPMPGVS